MAGRGLTPARLVGLLCLFLAVILACVLIGLSVAIVPWNHAALVQDEIKPQIFHEVWGSGRHFIGLGKRFHAFPLDYRLVDFSRLTQATSYGDEFYDAPALVGRTADGLGVSMAVTIFCKIRREELRELFISYCYGMSSSSGAKEFTCADKVVSLVALYARAALLNLVSETRTEDFFRERVRISTEMTRVVSEAVAPLHMDVAFLTLREVNFDVDVDEAIESKIVTAQTLATKLLEQQTRQVTAEMRVYVAQADTEIAISLAAASAQQAAVEGAAEADAFLVDVVAEAAATRALRDTVYAPICASNATANDAVLASAFYAKVLAQPEGTRLLTGRVRATLLAALPACRCADGACPDAGWCRVATAACRGADGKLASYVGPNATETENTDVEWWAYC